MVCLLCEQIFEAYHEDRCCGADKVMERVSPHVFRCPVGWPGGFQTLQILNPRAAELYIYSCSTWHVA